MKLYIGGKQARPDSGYSVEVRGTDGRLLGEAPLGNRKDIRNAVEAARKAKRGQDQAAHAIVHRCCTTSRKICHSAALKSSSARACGREGRRRNRSRFGHRAHFSYAAWADKFDGAVHNPPLRNVSLAMNEAIGTVGIICPREMPLLDSSVMPAIAMGNTVRPVRNLSADHRGPVSGIRYQRSARRCGQYRQRPIG